MKKTKIILGMSTLALVATALLSSREAVAYQGDYIKTGPNCTSERHEEMTTALENNDYATWEGLMEGRGRVTQVINESNFARFAEAHRLASEGKYEEADAIREELGLRTRNGERINAGFRQGKGRVESN
jgi:hypothetical protein